MYVCVCICVHTDYLSLLATVRTWAITSKMRRSWKVGNIEGPDLGVLTKNSSLWEQNASQRLKPLVGSVGWKAKLEKPGESPVWRHWCGCWWVKNMCHDVRGASVNTTQDGETTYCRFGQEDGEFGNFVCLGCPPEVHSREWSENPQNSRWVREPTLNVTNNNRLNKREDIIKPWTEERLQGVNHHANSQHSLQYMEKEISEWIHAFSWH